MNILYKRFIGILLVIAVCLGSAGMVTAEENSVLSKDIAEAMDFLKILNVIPDYDEFNLDATAEVRRADFASAAAKLLNCGTFKGSGIYYYDVAQTHWAYNEIAYLTDKGILNGNGNKIFRPDDIIQKAEAYKVLLTALGYGDYAQYNGGFPFGYVMTADKLGLDEGLSNSQNLSMGEMILLLYNTATVPVFEATAFKGDSATYQVSEQNTLLSLYYSIYCDEEVVNGVDGISIDGTKCEKDTVLVGNEKYKSELKLDDFLGHKVRVFYHLDKKNEERTVFWMKKLDEALEIRVDNDASFDSVSFRLTYYPEGGKKSKTVTFDRGIKVVYNGEVISENIDDIFSLPEYNLKVIKTDGVYSVAIVSAYENLVIGSIDSISHTVYDKIDSKRRLILNEDAYEILQLKNSAGENVAFDKLANGNVLSYLMSPSEEILKVLVSTDQVTGKIERMKESQGNYVLTVNSVDYYMPVKEDENKVKAGNNVVLYLDINGKVAYAVTADNTIFAAYLINGSMSDSPFSSTLKFRMLTGEGVKYLEGNDKIKIDGQRLNADSALKLLYEDGAFAPQFAMVGINKDGVVNIIDTIATNTALEGENYLRVSIPYSDNLHFKQNGTLGPKGTINDNTLFFSVPSENIGTAEDDEFFVISKNSIVDAVAVKAESYKTTERIAYEQFVVLKDYAGDPLGKENPIVVSEILKEMNSDGEIVEVVEGFQGGASVLLRASKGVSFLEKGISAGDIIRIKKSIKNEIMDYTVLFDCSEPAKYIVAPQMDVWFSYGVGYVYDVVDNVVKIGYSKPVELDWSIAVGGKPVLVCENTERGLQINVGNINDALTRYNEKNDDMCSMIFTFQRNCTTEFVVIYR